MGIRKKGGRGTHRDDGADDEGVVVAEDLVVRALEADVELGGGVLLHVLQRAAGEHQSSTRGSVVRQS
jgi:hypothetical protein